MITYQDAYQPIPRGLSKQEKKAKEREMKAKRRAYLNSKIPLVQAQFSTCQIIGMTASEYPMWLLIQKGFSTHFMAICERSEGKFTCQYRKENGGYGEECEFKMMVLA